MDPFASIARPSASTPGWHPDPWRQQPWRWWDGAAWTHHIHSGRSQSAQPRISSWMSVPVIVGSVVAVLNIVITIAVAPLTGSLGLLLGFTPLIIVFPVLYWLDRIEPEPWASRIHALLWGITVAGSVSLIINTVFVIAVSGATGVATGQALGAVVSAPLIEEFSKGLGVYWALRRKELDGVMDGVVYAGWVGLGFAMIEDFLYFAEAGLQGQLLGVFVGRALLTPFAHPLFTAWTGLAIGLAVARRQSILANAFWGYGLAVVSHAAWNGAITYSDEKQNYSAMVIVAGCFVALFIAAAITLVLIRRNQQRNFLKLIPFIAQRFGMSQNEIQVFSSWSTLLRARRGLSRPQKRSFDRVHSALARLALLYRRPGELDTVTEQLLADQLFAARNATEVNGEGWLPTNP